MSSGLASDNWVVFAERCDCCGRPRGRGELFGGAYGRDGRRGSVCSECYASIAADPEYPQRIPVWVRVRLVETVSESSCPCCGGQEYRRDESGAKICARCSPK